MFTCKYAMNNEFDVSAIDQPAMVCKVENLDMNILYVD